jgi:hypothetical protein
LLCVWRPSARPRGFLRGHRATLSSDCSLRFEQSSPPEISAPERPGSRGANRSFFDYVTAACRFVRAFHTKYLRTGGKPLKSAAVSADPHDYNIEFCTRRHPLCTHSHEPPNWTEHCSVRLDRLLLRGCTVSARPAQRGCPPSSPHCGRWHPWSKTTGRTGNCGYDLGSDRIGEASAPSGQSPRGAIAAVCSVCAGWKHARVVRDARLDERRERPRCSRSGSGDLGFAAESRVGWHIPAIGPTGVFGSHRDNGPDRNACEPALGVHGRSGRRDDRGRGPARLRHDRGGRGALAGESRRPSAQGLTTGRRDVAPDAAERKVEIKRQAIIRY